MAANFEIKHGVPFLSFLLVAWVGLGIFLKFIFSWEEKRTEILKSAEENLSIFSEQTHFCSNLALPLSGYFLFFSPFFKYDLFEAR